ncbi:Antigenic thaumatin-like protein [Penicillium rolfsii]|nr:Antigenic thaumatin-like protein [Penicillium rolfsii]
MRFAPAAIAIAAALAPLASAVGNARVVNQCGFPVYVWSVGGSVSQQNTVASGGTYSEVLHHDPASGGIAIKLTTVANGLYNGSPQTNFAYTLDGQQVWYDLSDVFGDPFSNHAINVKASASCPSICWPSGIATSGASQVKVCDANSDVTLTLCSGTC